MNHSLPTMTRHITFRYRIILSAIDCKILGVYARFKSTCHWMLTSTSKQARRLDHAVIYLLNLSINQGKLIILLKLFPLSELCFLLGLISFLALLILFNDMSFDIGKIEILKGLNLSLIKIKR